MKPQIKRLLVKYDDYDKIIITLNPFIFARPYLGNEYWSVGSD